MSELSTIDRPNRLAGIILSGAAASVYDGQINFDNEWFDQGVPILGICYGHQLLAANMGGTIKVETSEFGPSQIQIHRGNALFAGVQEGATVWMSHRDSVTSLKDDCEVLASTESSFIAAFKSNNLPFYGVQFHPEVSHTEPGPRILENFCTSICGAHKGEMWSAGAFVEETTKRIQQTVGRATVILGLSGGVDSLVLATLLRRSLAKHQLWAVYVDSGLMPDDTESEVQHFCEDLDIPLVVTDQGVRFFGALEGVVDPAIKCNVIGHTFIEVFQMLAGQVGATIFAQGTIWSDVIESGVTKFSSRIKPHHNVGGLPTTLTLALLEPLRDLFKDQVRSVARQLDLPDWVVTKRVFPGPGFAIRVQGVVTKDKVQLIKATTRIVEDIVLTSAIKDDVWMAFAILIDVPSLGIKGDERVENQHAAVVRIVESQNSLTANFSRKAFALLADISRRITRETAIGRVVYDITDKPPGTIEWQ